MNSRVMSRRFGYLPITLVAFLGLVTLWGLSRGAFADPVAPAGAEEGRPVTDDLALSRLLEREIDIQQQRHKERITQLEQLRASLRDANAPPAQIEAVDKLIREENRDYRARVAQLERLAFAAPSATSPVTREYQDFATALSRLNQSFVIAPIVGSSGATGGSYYIDRRAQRAAERDPLVRDPRLPEGEVVTPETSEHVVLPPPVVLGTGRATQLPSWLYGLPTTAVQIRPGPPPMLEHMRDLDESVEALRNEVRALRNQLQQQQQQQPNSPME